MTAATRMRSGAALILAAGVLLPAPGTAQSAGGPAAASGLFAGAQPAQAAADPWKGEHVVLQGVCSLRSFTLPANALSTVSTPQGSVASPARVRDAGYGVRVEGDWLGFAVGRTAANFEWTAPAGSGRTWELTQLELTVAAARIPVYAVPGTGVALGLVLGEVAARVLSDFDRMARVSVAAALPAVRVTRGPALLDVRFGEIAWDWESVQVDASNFFGEPWGQRTLTRSRLGFVPALELRAGMAF